ncbi:hypothetical protein Q5M85_14325 [Paraclostridium bifermentans]|nr:hypothetical protein [Paraclostridium bifermentans]
MSKKRNDGIKKRYANNFSRPVLLLDPKMSIGKTIIEGVKKHKNIQNQDAYDIAKESLELCGLDKSYMDRYPHEFSGGQRQRIANCESVSIKTKVYNL